MTALNLNYYYTLWRSNLITFFKPSLKNSNLVRLWPFLQFQVMMLFFFTKQSEKGFITFTSPSRLNVMSCESSVKRNFLIVCILGTRTALNTVTRLFTFLTEWHLLSNLRSYAKKSFKIVAKIIFYKKLSNLVQTLTFFGKGIW